MRPLFRQFSTPGGVPSHVSPPTPGSIHEGGELGYVLTHAFGAVFDNPELIVVAVVGDGEAETGPLEGSWKGISFLNPRARRRGAADPAPQRLQDLRADRARPLERRRHRAVCCAVTATIRASSKATSRSRCTRRSRARSSAASTTFARIQTRARGRRRDRRSRPRWPAIVLRTPKGWTGPQDRRRRAGRRHVPRAPGAALRRAHQPRAPGDARALDAELSPGRAVRRAGPAASERSPRWRPTGDAAHGREPARERRHAAQAPAISRISRTYALTVPQPGAELHESTRQLGQMLRDIYATIPTISGCSVPTRPTRIASARSSRSNSAASSRRQFRATITSPATGA